MASVFKAREVDLQLRGENYLVYDRKGKVVPLIKAKIWVDGQGKYFEPEIYIKKRKSVCIIL